jgi:hypothetical protein
MKKNKKKKLPSLKKPNACATRNICQNPYYRILLKCILALRKKISFYKIT